MKTALLALALAVTCLGTTTASARILNPYTAEDLCLICSGVVDNIAQTASQGLPYEAAITMIDASVQTDPTLYQMLRITVDAIYGQIQRILSIMQSGRWQERCVSTVIRGYAPAASASRLRRM